MTAVWLAVAFSSGLAFGSCCGWYLATELGVAIDAIQAERHHRT